MAIELQTHAQLAAAPGETSPPIVVRTDVAIGLLALGECTQGGADGEAAVHLVMNAVGNQLELCSEEIEAYRAQPTDALRAKLLQLLEEAVLRAGRELFLFARRRGGSLGVGLEVLLRVGNEVLAAHVGHGGVYLVRRDLLHRLARGRSPQPDAGPPTGSRWDVTDEPVLLGRDSQVTVQTLVFEIWPGDHLALLTSGLANRLADADIRTLLAVLEPDQAARGLLHMARERGAPGALGAYLARVPGQPDQVSESVVSLLPVLAKIPLLNWCNREDLLDVAAVARPLRIARGQIIFAEGEEGNELYLLVRGDVSVVSGGTGVAHLGPGSTFGEMALLDQPLRSATVEALNDGELLVISRESFFTLLKANPNLAVKLLWNLLLAVSGNLRRTTALMSGLVSGTRGLELDEEDDPTLQVRRKGRPRST
jgi:CRP-like cAMP-binding protein/serine/threonine protein phosphatase PrpC